MAVQRSQGLGGSSDRFFLDDENSPRGRASAVSARGQVIQSSPLRRGHRIESPVSPTPAGPANSATNLTDLFSDGIEPAVVKV